MADDAGRLNQVFAETSFLYGANAALIEDLHETISRQWKLIDELTRKLERVTRQLRDVEGNAGAAPVDRPPPHY